MYDIQFTKRAEDFFKKLDKSIQEQIAKKIDNLINNPRLGKPLLGDLKGQWSLRIGKYRAIYVIKNKELVILVLKLDLRKKSY